MKIPATEGREIKFVALPYQKQELPIFPCKGIVPWETTFFEKATRGVIERYKWFNGFPDANLGFATGLNCFVVEACYPDGSISLALLEKEYTLLPETAEVRIGNGSRQLFFNCPKEFAITSSSNQLGEGIAVYGKGQFVLLPPSIQANDMPNKWRTSAPVSDAPHWLIELITTTCNDEKGSENE